MGLCGYSLGIEDCGDLKNLWMLPRGNSVFQFYLFCPLTRTNDALLWEKTKQCVLITVLWVSLYHLCPQPMPSNGAHVTMWRWSGFLVFPRSSCAWEGWGIWRQCVGHWKPARPSASTQEWHHWCLVPVTAAAAGLLEGSGRGFTLLSLDGVSWDLNFPANNYNLWAWHWVGSLWSRSFGGPASRLSSFEKKKRMNLYL